MGRQESLTALALGRGHYEDEVIRDPETESSRGSQQYNDRGYPRNPETKRREREHVRAANELMLVTGVVEDALAAREKADQYIADKNRETFIGLRLMDVCRASFVAGTWGVIGMRRRILLYKQYTEMALLKILRRETTEYSAAHMALAGLPATLTYHVLDWTVFFADMVVEAFLTGDDKDPGEQARIALRSFLAFGLHYIGFHLRMFATLQQLNLISASRFLPSLKTFILFSSDSPFQLPSSPFLSRGWISSLLWTAAPIFVMVGYENIRGIVSKIVYRPIYKSLPRPTGDSMFHGHTPAPPEYDTYNMAATSGGERTDYDEPTLRALEGLPALDTTEQRQEREDSSEEEDDELAHATLISFDVEATEGAESSSGPWAAELRSAHDPKPSDGVKYRVTGLTMLPAIMATEALRDIVAGFVAMPFEAIMVRVLARACWQSARLGVGDLFEINPHMPVSSWGSLLSVAAMHVVVTGTIWVGFAGGTQFWISRGKMWERLLQMAPSLASRQR